MDRKNFSEGLRRASRRITDIGRAAHEAFSEWQHSPDDEIARERARIQSQQALERTVLTRGRLAEINRNSAFDVNEYIEERLANPSLLTIEIGPGNRPTLKTSVESDEGSTLRLFGTEKRKRYTGKSAFVGIEAFMHERFENRTAQTFEELIQARPDENIFLIEDRTVGRKRDPDDPNTLYYYDHETRTNIKTKFDEGVVYDHHLRRFAIPSERASEVVASYVLDDYQADNELVIAEANRMLQVGGIFAVSDEGYRAELTITELEEGGFEVVYGHIVSGRYYEDTPADTEALTAMAAFGFIRKECDMLIIARKLGPVGPA